MAKQAGQEESKPIAKKKGKKGGVAAAKKKFAKQFNQGVGCQILVKGESGQVVDFEDEDEEDENNQEVDNNMERLEEGKAAVKKKKKKKEAAKIGSEDTLDMIKNALKGAPSGRIVDELSTAVPFEKPSSAKAKKKKTTKTKVAEKDEETKEVQDDDQVIDDGEDKLSGE